MHHLYRLRSGFVTRFNVDPSRIQHHDVVTSEGEIHHVLSSEDTERQLFVLQCEYLNAKYSAHHPHPNDHLLAA